MVRAVDPRRTRKALRRVRRLAASAAEGSLSDWEKTFLGEVGARLEEYGSAFADYAKGAPDEALSRLQNAKLREISSKTARDDKAAQRPPPVQPEEGGHKTGPRSALRKPQGFGRRAPMRTKRSSRPNREEEDG